MQIADFIVRPVYTIDQNEPVVEAARLMRRFGVKELVVTRDRAGRATPMGLVRDTDIVLKAIAQNPRALMSTMVADVMEMVLTTLRSTDTVVHAVQHMSACETEKSPVLSPQGELLGLVSLTTLLACLRTRSGSGHFTQREWTTLM